MSRSGSKVKGHRVKNVLSVFQVTRKASIRDLAARSSQEVARMRSDHASTSTRKQDMKK